MILDADAWATIVRVLLVCVCSQVAVLYGYLYLKYSRRWAHLGVTFLCSGLAFNFLVAVEATRNGTHPVNTLPGLIVALAGVVIVLAAFKQERERHSRRRIALTLSAQLAAFAGFGCFIAYAFR